MEPLISRQAIFNNKNETVAYHISFEKNVQELEDVSISLENMINGKAVYLHYKDYLSYKLLLQDIDKEKIHIVMPYEDFNDVTEALSESSYKWAVEIESPELFLEQPVQADAYIIKHSESSGLNSWQTLIQHLQSEKKSVQVEGVDTTELFEQYSEVGCTQFKGSYLTQPDLRKDMGDGQNGLVMMKLLSILQQPEICIDEVEQALSQDPRLAFKLLKAVNSPAHGLRREINSLHEAIVYIGLHEIKRWASLAAMSNVEGKPMELMAVAVIRARMCELLAEQLRVDDTGAYFTAGLFSTIDALFDKSLEQLLSELSLSETLKKALIEKQGEIGETLQTVLRYEQAAWDDLPVKPENYESLVRAYVESVDWADTYCGSVS